MGTFDDDLPPTPETHRYMRPTHSHFPRRGYSRSGSTLSSIDDSPRVRPSVGARPQRPGMRSESTLSYSDSSAAGLSPRRRGGPRPIPVMASAGASTIPSSAIPSDPTALGELLYHLKAAYPNMAIPPELTDAARWPSPAGLVGMQHPPPDDPPDVPPPGCGMQKHLASYSSFSPPRLGEVPRWNSHRLESSIDSLSTRSTPSASPVGDPSEGLFHHGVAAAAAEGVHQAKIDHLEQVRANLLSPDQLRRRTPAPPHPPAPATPRAPPDAQETEKRPPALSPKQTFYDRLGRQLTELLLSAGAPLPRFPLNAPQCDSQTQTAERSGVSGNDDQAESEDTMLAKAHAAAEMFLKDYYEHKKAVGQLQGKLDMSENENLALRTQLDLAMVKMMAAQKELDKYATYFNLSRPEAQWPDDSNQQVRALLRKLQDMGRELQDAVTEKKRMLREQEEMVDKAVQRALDQRAEEVSQLKANLKEKKKLIKDMKLMLHTYLATNDPTDLNPRLAFLDIKGPATQKSATVGTAVAL